MERKTGIQKRKLTFKNRVCSQYGRTSGSITLFLALIMTLVFSLFFSLLEAARVQALDEIAARSLLLELESAFGEYQPDLWQDYGLLFLDGGNDSGELDLALLEGHRMEEAALEQKGTGFYQMALQNLQFMGYTLATDAGGAAFQRQACAAIQAQLAAGAAKSLQATAQKGKELAEESGTHRQQWNSAKDAMTKADEIEKDKESAASAEQGMGKNKASSSFSGEGSKKTDVTVPSQKAGGRGAKNLPENPVDSVDVLKNSMTLALVVENPSEISAKTISLSDTLGSRKIAQGNWQLPKSGSLDKLWFLQYLNQYFSCGSGAGKKGSENHALEYELEYCVAGKSSDYENLEKTVKELLLIREAGNFMTIMQDGQKQALALEIATAAVGFTGLAPLIQAVQIGILLAWSYIESILDVRCLLSGGNVPLVKAVSDWKSDVSLGEKMVADKEEKTESRKEGLNYREYLQILLSLVAEDTLAYRAMDVVERNIALKESEFRMDCQIHGVQAEGLYTAKPLFLGFVTAHRVKDGTYHFLENSECTYLQ